MPSQTVWYKCILCQKRLFAVELSFSNLEVSKWWLGIPYPVHVHTPTHVYTHPHMHVLWSAHTCAHTCSSCPHCRFPKFLIHFFFLNSVDFKAKFSQISFWIHTQHWLMFNRKNDFPPNLAFSLPLGTLILDSNPLKVIKIWSTDLAFLSCL